MSRGDFNCTGFVGGKFRAAALLRRVFQRGLPVIFSWLVFARVAAAQSDDNGGIARQLEELRQANAALRAELQEQKQAVSALNQQVSDLQAARTERERQLAEIKEGSTPAPPTGFSLGRLHISGEGGVGFFNTGSEGFAPHSEFRVDEARLFVESPIWENVYFFSELNLSTREDATVNLKLGEFYLDFEDVSLLWNREGQMSVRAGRLDIPFGEEYLVRDAIDNALISHSLADFWGVDEGVELYGALGKFSYVLAVQNGGISDTRDFNRDKSVAARLSFNPNSNWHFSASAMRTGNLDVGNDSLSAIWFGNAFFKPLDYGAGVFHADMVEGDARYRWKTGQLAASGGAVCYGDDAPASTSGRTVYFYAVEARQQLARKLYVAARFSELLARNGFPIVANGSYNNFFYGPLTDEIWRASLGLGYHFSEKLLLKAEYSIERGRETGGVARNHEDFFALEAALKF